MRKTIVTCNVCGIDYEADPPTFREFQFRATANKGTISGWPKTIDLCEYCWARGFYAVVINETVEVAPLVRDKENDHLKRILKGPNRFNILIDFLETVLTDHGAIWPVDHKRHYARVIHDLNVLAGQVRYEREKTIARYERQAKSAGIEEVKKIKLADEIHLDTSDEEDQ